MEDEFGLAGSSLSDRYDIERVVASGGFGLVYFGRHRALKSPIAVKVLRTPLELTATEEKDFADRFLAEAQVVAELQHAAVVRALDFGVSAMPNGRSAPWTIFEWVEGQTLKGYFEARGGEPMPPGEALALLRPVFEGLAAAHARGIAHRDVKPPNIMLPCGPSGLSSRILDFGIAKTMSPEEASTPTGNTRTGPGAAGYSLNYASPEQIGNTRTGPWTDVHALALVLTEALVGHPPLQGEDFVDIAAVVLSTDRPTPRRFGVDVGAWEPVIARAMAMKPSGRYANAAEFLAALEASTEAAPRPRFAPLWVAAALLVVLATVGAAVALHARHSAPARPPPRGAPTASPVTPAQPASVIPPPRVQPSSDASQSAAPPASASHARPRPARADGRTNRPESPPATADPTPAPVAPAAPAVPAHAPTRPDALRGVYQGPSGEIPGAI